MPTEQVQDPAMYAWIIDQEHLGDEPGAVGRQGPRDADLALIALLDSGEGEAFRILDDDGELYYSGRIVFASPCGDEDDLAPLHDFGGPNAGATEIQYCESGTWVTR